MPTLSTFDNSDKIREKCKQEGLKVVPSDPFTLQIDLDRDENEEVFNKNIEILEKILTVTDIKYTKSKSGRTHIYVTVEECLTEQERIMYQACLGSDPTRELLSRLNIKQGSPHPIFLYEVDEEARKRNAEAEKRALNSDVYPVVHDPVLF